jgi:hypothetical protein
MANLLLSAATICAFMLIFGAYRLWKRDGDIKKPFLMCVAALVIAGNIAIIAVPDGNGRSLIKQQQ